jgi:hypothetical protein
MHESAIVATHAYRLYYGRVLAAIQPAAIKASYKACPVAIFGAVIGKAIGAWSKRPIGKNQKVIGR